MTYCMDETGRRFFSKKQLTQKTWFLFLLTGILYAFVITTPETGDMTLMHGVSLFMLLNVVALLQVAISQKLRKTISGYQTLNDGFVCFTCYSGLWFTKQTHMVYIGHIQWDLFKDQQKKNAFGISPTVYIRDRQSSQSFYYFPGYFNDEDHLLKECRKYERRAISKSVCCN